LDVTTRGAAGVREEKTSRQNTLGLETKMEPEDWTELLTTLTRKVQI